LVVLALAGFAGATIHPECGERRLCARRPIIDAAPNVRHLKALAMEGHFMQSGNTGRRWRRQHLNAIPYQPS
jgi:hypothetical protein